MYRVAYPQLHCMCPKRWQRWHCSGPFGATYDSTDTHKPQSSESDYAFDNSGPCTTDTMKGDGRVLLGGVLVATAGSQLCDSLDSNVEGFKLISDDVLTHTPTQVIPYFQLQRKLQSGTVQGAVW